MITDARQRMNAAVQAGKFPDAEAWCRGILNSTDNRIPAEWRMFAARHLAVLINIKSQDDDPRAWARRLRDQEDAGVPLVEAQRKAWRQVLGYIDKFGEVVAPAV